MAIQGLDRVVALVLDLPPNFVSTIRAEDLSFFGYITAFGAGDWLHIAQGGATGYASGFANRIRCTTITTFQTA